MERSLAEANARLISAAPDLLEALKLAEILLANCLPIIRAAIDEAEGRS